MTVGELREWLEQLPQDAMAMIFYKEDGGGTVYEQVREPAITDATDVEFGYPIIAFGDGQELTVTS